MRASLLPQFGIKTGTANQVDFPVEGSCFAYIWTTKSGSSVLLLFLFQGFFPMVSLGRKLEKNLPHAGQPAAQKTMAMLSSLHMTCLPEEEYCCVPSWVYSI